MKFPGVSGRVIGLLCAEADDTAQNRTNRGAARNVTLRIACLTWLGARFVLLDRRRGGVIPVEPSGEV